MAGPWEKYPAGEPKTPSGPWEKYQASGPELRPSLSPTAEPPAGPWTKYAPAAQPDGGPQALQERGVGVGGPVPSAPAGEVGVGGSATLDSGRAPPPAVPAGPGVFDFFTKSLLVLQRTRNVTAEVLLGRKDQAAAALEFAEIAKQRDALEEHPEYTKALRMRKARDEGLAPQYEGWTGGIRFLYDHPRYAAETIGESVVPTLESVVGGVVGGVGGGLVGGAIAGPPGAIVGRAVGGGLGVGAPAGITEGLGKYLETLQEAGIDITNEESLAGAFANPELLAEAKQKALKKGLSVSFFDGITASLGIMGFGKPLSEAVFDPIARVVGAQTLKKTAAREAIEQGAANLLFLEAPGGMFGEAVGEQLAEGEIDPVDVLLEGVGEVALSGPQVGLEVAASRMGRETPAATAEQIKDVFTAITEVPSYETAEAEGRNWFGFVDTSYQQAGQKFDEKGKLVQDDPAKVGTRVYRDYTQAEETMGRNDPRQGKLVAASEDDITAILTDAEDQAQKGTATPRFIQPETAAEARQLWEDFASNRKGGQAYRQAVELGLRLTPTRESAEFVGDLTSSEILPKSEFTLRQDSMEVRFIDSQTGKESTLRGAFGGVPPINLGSLLQDERFVVRPAKQAIQELRGQENTPQMAAALFEVLDPQLETEIATTGWETFLAKTNEVVAAFEQQKLKMRPSLAWNPRGWAFTPRVVISTKMAKAETRAALEKHRSILPQDELKTGVPIDDTDQTPEIGGPLRTNVMNVSPVAPMQPSEIKLMFTSTVPQDAQRVTEAFATIAQKVLKGLGVKKRLVIIVSDPWAVGELKSQFTGTGQDELELHATVSGPHFVPITGGDMLIYVNPQDSAPLYRILMHEFGHALGYATFSLLPSKLQAQIFAAYRRYLLTYRGRGVRGQREHQMRRQMGPVILGMGKGPVYTGDAESYYITFEEWFAEQTARWGTTSAKPVGAAARYFQRLGRTIIRMVREVLKLLPGVQMKAEPVMQEWLDSAYMGRRSWSPGIRQSLVEVTRAANAKHGVKHPLQAESVKAMDVIRAMAPNGIQPPAGSPPGDVDNLTPGALQAQNDRFNVLMKYGVAFHQLAQENPDIPALQLYTELMRMMRLDVNNIMAEAETILKQFIHPLWKEKTGGKRQTERLADFLFDLTEMNYRTTDEVRKGVRRNPTAGELQALVRRHQLSENAKNAYQQIRDFFVQVVVRGEELAIQEAHAVFANNPDQLRIAIGRAQILTRRLLSAPYFPMTRFGNWAVTVRDAGGNIEIFETYESKREQGKAAAEAARQYPASAGWSITESTLPEEVRSFVGMPPWFLDQLAKMPGMTPEQQEWLQLLRYEVAPARSFRKHLLPRKKTPGYSRDLERVFARYAFQHARNYGRLKFQRALDAQIKALRGEFVQTEPGRHDVTKRTRMADFLEDHFKEVMNPRADWHLLRSVTSVWYLGFMVSSAALNMTQTLLMTFPYLGSKFGDVKAMKAIMRAGGSISTYYKRGSYENQTDGEMQMLDYLIKRGDITESMAAELAGVAAGNALDSYVGWGDQAHRKWLAFADKAMLLFKLVEQWNRRVTARAAYHMAMAEPNNEWVQGLRTKYYLQFQAMLASGVDARQALATLAAGDAINNTQYDYSKEARPRFMRGRAGLLFAFYMFTQNTIFQLASRENKGLFVRYALIMTFLAGPMGLLPDEAEDILNFVGRRFFGKDFSVALEARRLVNSLVGDPKYTDGILHGTGRYTFGIPALMEAVGGPAIPEIDMSRLVELRNIAPLPITRGLDVIDRGVNIEKQISRWTQDMAGAGFGLPFAWAQALGDGELDISDPKRWERAVPRAMGKLMQAWRLTHERGERVGRSNYIMEYDKSDPQDVAEIVAKALGFTPTREALSWDLSAAQREVSMFWSSKRQALLARAYEARFVHREAEMWKEARQAIMDFNKEVPDPKLRISGDTMKRSFSTRRRTQREFLEGDGPNIPPRLGRDIRALFPAVRRVSEERQRPPAGP